VYISKVFCISYYDWYYLVVSLFIIYDNNINTSVIIQIKLKIYNIEHTKILCQGREDNPVHTDAL